MANFQTHFTAGTVASSLATSTVLSLQLVAPQEAAILWLFGVLGGMLPDIDSDNSTSLSLIFNFFALIVALALGSVFYPVLSVVGLWLVAGLSFALIRFAFLPLFENMTVHRGTVHSLLGCLMFGLIAVQLSTLAGKSEVFSWCAGVFIILGMLVHLSLDEAYSVDLANLEFKRSFGTALKPLDIDYPLTTGAHILVCALLIYFAPSPQPLITALEQGNITFLPTHDWDNLVVWGTEVIARF
jgi:hypothetical protein